MNKFSPENIEAEIATLSTMIEEKRRALENMRGIESDTPEKEVVDRETIKSFIEDIHKGYDALDKEPKVNVSSNVKTDDTKKSIPVGKSYLDSLEDGVVDIVNKLIALVPEKGIKVALKEAKKNEPLVIDAFHDALVEHLYVELKARKIV